MGLFVKEFARAAILVWGFLSRSSPERQSLYGAFCQGVRQSGNPCLGLFVMEFARAAILGCCFLSRSSLERRSFHGPFFRFPCRTGLACQALFFDLRPRRDLFCLWYV